MPMWHRAVEPTGTGLARITAALVALNWWIGWGTGSGADETANNVTVGVATEARGRHCLAGHDHRRQPHETSLAQRVELQQNLRIAMNGRSL